MSTIPIGRLRGETRGKARLRSASSADTRGREGRAGGAFTTAATGAEACLQRKEMYLPPRSVLVVLETALC
jgi:hypothetical protein